MDFEGAKHFITEKLRTELSAELSYHNIRHVLDVYEIADKLAGMEGIAGEDRNLLLTAVLFHDSGFLRSKNDHETASCEIATQNLPAFGYEPKQIDRILGMIRATRLPQTPHNLMEEIICDADLDYLGRDDFWTIGTTLFEELKRSGVVSSLAEWDHQQIAFLEKHSYFTKSANATRKATKEAHLAELKTRVSS